MKFRALICRTCGDEFYGDYRLLNCPDHRYRQVAERVRQMISCPVCGTEFKQMQRRVLTCSRECGQRLRYASDPIPERSSDTHSERARRFGVEYSKINRRDIFDRDGWVCWLCAGAINPEAKWPDRQCASLDHVVPMSKGGPHRADNVRAAHWICNVLRGDRPVDQVVEARYGTSTQAA